MSLDPWWNRNFPAHSGRRLAFLLCAVPVIALVVARFRSGVFKEDVTAAEVAIVSLVGMGVVVIGWILARDQARGAAGGEQRTAWWRPDPLQDFLYSSAIAFVAFSAMNISFLGTDESSFPTLLITLGTAVGFALVMRGRFSIWSVIAVSIAVGYPVGAVIQLFLYWFVGDEGLLGYWFFASLITFVFLAPLWYGMRSKRHILERIPLWIMTLVATLPVALIAAFVGAGSTGASTTTTEQASSRPDAAWPAAFGRPTREQASIDLMNAWRSGNRAAAVSVARTGAVDDLFAEAFHPTTVFRGCGTVPGGWVRCALAIPRGLLLLVPERTPGGAFYISHVERVASSYPIDYGIHGSTPSAGETPRATPTG